MAVLSSPLHYQNPTGALAAGLRMAYVIQAQVNMILADQVDLRRFVTYAGDIAGSGSDTINVRYSDINKTPFAAIAETGALVPSAAAGTAAAITIARSGLEYQVSDLLQMTSVGNNDLDPFSIAQRLVDAGTARLNEVICSTFTSITTSKGTSGISLSVDDFLISMYHLENQSNAAPFTCILHNKQFSDLQSSLRAENNNFLAFSEGTEFMSGAKPQGYAGNLLGVDIVRSAYVQEDGGAINYIGAMFSKGGVGYGIGSVTALSGTTSVYRPAGTPIVVTLARTEGSAITSIVGNLYCGSSILEDDRCVKLVTGV